jgi:hypothetical protein
MARYVISGTHVRPVRSATAPLNEQRYNTALRRNSQSTGRDEHRSPPPGGFAGGISCSLAQRVRPRAAAQFRWHKG